MPRERTDGTLMTLEEYLAFEEKTVIKHEYVAGEVFAMCGVTTRHNLITLNIARALHQSSRRRGCRVFATEVKLHVADRIYYPDIMLACGKAAAVELIIERPSLVVEVTSPSTRAIDRREKLEAYRRIPSLLSYLIVDQRRRHVLSYSRQPKKEWTRTELVDGEIQIAPLDTPLGISEIYEDVTLPPLAVGEEEWEENEPSF